MQHHQCANAPGFVTPVSDEAHSTPHAAGLRDYEKQQANTSGKSVPLQVVHRATLVHAPLATGGAA